MEGLENLQGKCVVVSGGTKGIGLAVAKLLVQEGAHVFVFGRHQEHLDEALEELGKGAKGATADQSDPEQVKRVFEKASEELGGLDFLINNAAGAAKSVAETEMDEWIYVVQANLIGYMLNCAVAIPMLKERGQGRIINVGSMSAKICEEGSDVYVATKSGIRGFSDSLGKTLADSNIGVTLIEPGLVATELTENSPAEQTEKLSQRRMILPEDVARSIVFALQQPIGCSIPLLQVRPLCQKI